MKKTLFSSIFVMCLLLRGPLFGALSNDPNFLNMISKQVAQRKEGGILNLSFKSTIDGSIQPLLLKIPKNYDPATKWPLLVVLHGLKDDSIIVPWIDSVVQIGPFGRGDLFYRGMGEKDVFETLEMAKKIFNVDEDRIYLTGFSMGGCGTFELGLKYPYLWAGCVPVCGRLQNPLLIDNGLNLPFWIQAGSQDTVIPASNSQIVYELAQEKGFSNWRYTEHEEMGHSFKVNWPEIEQWLLKQSREKQAARIVYSGRIPAKVYWFEVKELIDQEKSYRLEARVDGEQIHLKTDNIESYMIHLKECPVTPESEPVLFENGIQIDLEENPVILR